eukprot:764954-Hanusia_phi.AAC.3
MSPLRGCPGIGWGWEVVFGIYPPSRPGNRVKGRGRGFPWVKKGVHEIAMRTPLLTGRRLATGTETWRGEGKGGGDGMKV